MTVYLVKANDEVLSFCTCAEAMIAQPPQMDCPWCGCGWLFVCIECRKAFTFARGVEVDCSLEDIGRRDLAGQLGRTSKRVELHEWVELMEYLPANVECGKDYVYLDGNVRPTDIRKVRFDGWHARHQLEELPHLQALDDRSVLDSTVGSKAYWESRRLRSHE